MTASDEPASVLVIRRTIPVPRARVFDAWLDPVKLARFMRPPSVTSATAEVDPRVGGRFRVVMDHERGVADHWGEYLEIDPPSRLSFTWSSASTDGQPTTVTVELHERADGGTDLVLTHRGLPDRAVDAHQRGWGAIVRELGAMSV